MSSALVKKALELYDEDLSESTSKKKNFQTTNSDVKKRNSKKSSKKKKNVIEKYRDKQNVKYTEQNLNFLRNMNESKESTKEMLRKIILKSGMCSSRKLYKNKKPKQKPQSTVFSDEDFKKFEKEYFS